MTEIWVDIPDTPGYQASSLGSIRSVPRAVVQSCRWGGTIARKFRGVALKPSPNSKGYLHVAIKRKVVVVAKLVALAFLGPRPAGHEINHKDGVKTNNRPENLEYVTGTRNKHHAMQTGLRKLKITADQIEEIKALAGRYSLRKIGRHFGIHHSYVRYLLNGRRKVTNA